MSYRKEDFFFPSSDGKHNIHAEEYIPEGEIRAVVQLSHGMIDYVSRYEGIAERLTKYGYVFAGNDHLGHGGSAGGRDELGFFAEGGGADFVIRDVKRMNEILREKYPGLPLFVIGHSMGSFIARCFIARYPDAADALIIHGTGGTNPLLPFGKFITAVTELFRGGHHRSRLLNSLAFGAYNKRFDPEEGENAWLTRDGARVAGRGNDPYTSYCFTVSAYRDLFRFVGMSNCKRWYRDYPKSLPTLIISGDMDPVGNYGKGPEEVYNRLLKAGCTDVSLKLYPGARHELFNETNREEVFDDIQSFLDRVYDEVRPAENGNG